MSGDKGKRAPAWVAAWLRPWWPTADKTPNGCKGRDLENTPGVAFEIKTGAEWRPYAWRKQVAAYPRPGELGILIYLPPGMGEAAVGDAMAILPLRELMPLLVAAGYAPPPMILRQHYTAQEIADAEARWSAAEGADD
jgi:hypothetical protein